MNDLTSQRLAVAGVAFALVVACHVSLPTVTSFTIALFLISAAVAWVLHVSRSRQPVRVSLANVSGSSVPESDSSLRRLEAELHSQLDQYQTDVARLEANTAAKTPGTLGWER